MARRGFQGEKTMKRVLNGLAASIAVRLGSGTMADKDEVLGMIILGKLPEREASEDLAGLH